MTKAPPQTRTLERRQRVQSAEMGLRILKALARLGGAASLTAVAADVGENTAKVHRYMASLIQEGLVAQNPATQHYYLGQEAIQIGLAALRQSDPIRLGEPALLRLREELKITGFIATMGNKGPTVLRLEEPALPVTVNVRAGSVLPLLWSATGQVFLSYLDDDDVMKQAQEELAAGSRDQRAAVSGRNPVEALRKRVRAQGCAVVNDTMLRGISAVSAPIFDHTGRLIAALTVLGASGSFDASAEGKVAGYVKRQAGEISAALGHGR
ncbi:transcriptional regulator, IclR family [Noviherbaspirillum humi]|uniref:Transcriptional regulator, IclR family n=1 Tax=Noviherbaspirillum humi TaxID=1688639 RepID=A0A239J1K7_9BURK|nr:IclR family transcriptional regulator [Noviherbaspirillum humi]SNS99710.1 transcriptional regulator, IclR family [Noviherbaspirillum humi]